MQRGITDSDRVTPDKAGRIAKAIIDCQMQRGGRGHSPVQ